MLRQASISLFILLNFNLIQSKSGGGHYSSQRSLGSGPLTGHGSASQTYWGTSMYPPDINSWYEYGMYQ